MKNKNQSLKKLRIQKPRNMTKKEGDFIFIYCNAVGFNILLMGWLLIYPKIFGCGKSVLNVL